MSLTASIKVSLVAAQTRAIDLASGNANLQRILSIAYTDGTGANQCNLIASDTRTIVNTENLDLTSTFTDIYGQAVNFARIKAILVEAASTNTSNIQFLRGASNGVGIFVANGDGAIVRPGGFVCWADPSATGIAVANGSSDVLTATNTSASSPMVSVSYNITILGADA